MPMVARGLDIVLRRTILTRLQVDGGTFPNRDCAPGTFFVPQNSVEPASWMTCEVSAAVYGLSDWISIENNTKVHSAEFL